MSTGHHAPNGDFSIVIINIKPNQPVSAYFSCLRLYICNYNLMITVAIPIFI